MQSYFSVRESAVVHDQPLSHAPGAELDSKSQKYGPNLVRGNMHHVRQPWAHPVYYVARYSVLEGPPGGGRV